MTLDGAHLCSPVGFGSRVGLRAYTRKHFALSSFDFSGLSCSVKL